MRFLLANCSAILLFGAPLLAQRPEARGHFTQGVGLYHEHDDSGDALVAAQAEFAAALRLEPRYAAARAYQGLIDLEMEREADAEAAFREALSWDPKCAEALVGQARLNQKSHPPREWLLLLRQAVSVAPRNALARRDLAYALTAESINPAPAMWKEAMECWRVLIAIDRNDRDAHYDLARALRRFGRWSEAEPHFREVLRIGPLLRQCLLKKLDHGSDCQFSRALGFIPDPALAVPDQPGPGGVAIERRRMILPREARGIAAVGRPGDRLRCRQDRWCLRCRLA